MTRRLKNNLLRALSFMLVFSLMFTFFIYYANFVISNNVHAINISWMGTHNFQTLPQGIKNENQATMTEVSNASALASNASELDIYDNKKITISNPLELYNFSIKTNIASNVATSELEIAKRNKFLGFDYVLADNIVYTQSDSARAVNPIAYMENAPFVGTFDGQGFEIRNMPIAVASGYAVNNTLPFAMFSQVGTNGKVKNVGIVNAVINSPTQNTLNLATLAGNNSGNITNSYVVGTTIGSKHNNSTYSEFFYSNSNLINNCYFVTANGDCHTIVNNSVSSAKTAAELKTELCAAANPAWYDYFPIDTTRPYPRLTGAKLVGNEYVLYSPTDIITLPALIDLGLNGRTFVLNNCLDMSFISAEAYRQAVAAFTGTFKSSTTGTCGTTHPIASSKTNYANHAIYNLSISGDNDKTITEFGMFKGENGANVSNINFIGGEIVVPKLANSIYSNPLNVGAVFSSASGRVSLDNVHSSMKISTLGDGTFLGMGMNVGSLAGQLTDFSIKGCSFSGSINMGYHNLSGTAGTIHQSSVGGILGCANSSNTNTSTTKNELSNCQNAGTVSGMAFSGAHVDGFTTAGEVVGNVTYSQVTNNQYTGGIAGGLFGNGSVAMNDLSNISKVSSHSSTSANPIENRSQEIKIGGLIGKYGLTSQNITNRFYNNAEIELGSLSEKSKLYAGGVFGDGRDPLGSSAGFKFNNIGNDINGIITLNSTKAASVYLGAILGYGYIDFDNIINNAPLNITLGERMSGIVSITAGIYGGYDGKVQNAGAITVTNNSNLPITELSVTALSYGLNVNGDNSAPIMVTNNGAVGDLNVGLSVFSNLSSSSNTGTITVTDKAAGLDVLNVVQKTLNVSGGSLKGNNAGGTNRGNISVAISAGSGSSSYAAYIGGLAAGLSTKATNCSTSNGSANIEFACSYGNADIVVAGVSASKYGGLGENKDNVYQILCGQNTMKGSIIAKDGLACKTLTVSGIAYQSVKLNSCYFYGEFIFNGVLTVSEEVNIAGIAYQAKEFFNNVNVSNISATIKNAKVVNVAGLINKSMLVDTTLNYLNKVYSSANLGDISVTLNNMLATSKANIAGVAGMRYHDNTAITSTNKNRSADTSNLTNKGAVTVSGDNSVVSDLKVGGVFAEVNHSSTLILDPPPLISLANIINLGIIEVTKKAGVLNVGGVYGYGMGNTIGTNGSGYLLTTTNSNLINAGNITAGADSSIGGVAGKSEHIQINGAINWGEISGSNIAAGIIGLMTGEKTIGSVVNHAGISGSICGGILGTRDSSASTGAIRFAVNYGKFAQGGTIVGDNIISTASSVSNVINFYEGNKKIDGKSADLITSDTAKHIYSNGLDGKTIASLTDATFAGTVFVEKDTKMRLNNKPNRGLLGNPYFFDDSDRTKGHIYALVDNGKYFNKNIDIKYKTSVPWGEPQWYDRDLDLTTPETVENIKYYIDKFNQIYLSDQADIKEAMQIVNTTAGNSYLWATYSASATTIDYFVLKSDVTAGDKFLLSEASNENISLDATLANIEFVIPTGEIGNWTGWTINRVNNIAVSACSTKTAKVTAEDGETVKNWTINLYVVDSSKGITLNENSAKIGDTTNAAGTAVDPNNISHNSDTNTYTFKYGDENSWIQPNENAFLTFNVSTSGYHRDTEFKSKKIQWRAKETDAWEDATQISKLTFSGKTANTYSNLNLADGTIESYAVMNFTVNIYENSGWYRLNIDDKIFIEIYRKESTATDFVWWNNPDYIADTGAGENYSARGIQIQSENDYVNGDTSKNDIFVRPKSGATRTFEGTVIYGDLPRFDLTKFDYSSTDLNNILFHSKTYYIGYKATVEFGGVEVQNYENTGDLKKYILYIFVYSEFETAHSPNNRTPVVYTVELTEKNIEASATYVRDGVESAYTGQTLNVKKDGTDGSIQIKQTSSATSYYTGKDEDGKRANIEVVGFKYIDAVNKTPISGLANMPQIANASSAGYSLTFVRETINGLYLFEVAYMRDDVKVTLKGGTQVSLSWRSPLSSVHVDKLASKNSYIESISIQTPTSEMWVTQTIGTVYIGADGKEVIKGLASGDDTPHFGLKTSNFDNNEVQYDKDTQNENIADIDIRINLFKIIFKYNLEDYVPPLGVLFGINIEKACTIKVKQPDETWKIVGANEYIKLNENVDTTIRVVAEDSRFFCDYIVVAQGAIPDKNITIEIIDQTSDSKAFPIALKTIIKAGDTFQDIEGSRYTTFIYKKEKAAYVLDTHVSAYYKLVMPAFAEYSVSSSNNSHTHNILDKYYYFDLNYSGNDRITITITITGYNADKPWGDATSW